MTISSLDLVLHACGGGLLVPEARAATLVGLALKTLRHHRCAGTEILPTRLIAGRRLVDARAIAAFLDRAEAPSAQPPVAAAADRPRRGRGRPKKLLAGGTT